MKAFISLSLALAIACLVSDVAELYQLNYRMTCTGKPRDQSDKQLGQFYYRLAAVNPVNQPYYIINNTVYARDCKYKCLYDDFCQSAEYNVDNKTCALYNNSDLGEILGYNNRILIRYIQCNINSSEVCGPDCTSTVDNGNGRLKSKRCLGLWEEYTSYHFEVKEHMSTSSIRVNASVTSLDEAFKICLESMECDAINCIVNRSSQEPISFQFLRTWVVGLHLSSKNISEEFFVAYKWNCGNCSENITSNWMVSNSSIQPEETKYFAIFYTVRASSCREECARINKQFVSIKPNDSFPLCKSVYYNETTKLCLVEDASNSSQCAQELLQSRYKGLTRKYTMKHDAYMKRHEDHACICLNANRKVYLDNCGRPDWMLYFKIFKSTALTLTYSQIQNDKYIYRQYFTGNEYVWVEYPSQENHSDIDRPCPDGIICHIFNANLNYPKNVELDIVESRQWGAQPPRHKVPFTKPIFYVEIEATLWPSCGCYTLEGCSDGMRTMQNMYINDVGHIDIDQNFVVGDDGRVYVGRGWKYQSITSFAYRENTIVIGIVGDFTQRFPSLKAINSLKAFLRKSVKDGKVASNFTLRERRIAFNNPLVRFVYLDLILTLWPSYGGRIKAENKNCFIIQLTFISLSSCAMALVMILLILLYLYKIDYYHLPACKRARNIILAKQNIGRCDLIWSLNKNLISDIENPNAFTLNLNLISSAHIVVDLKSDVVDCNCSLQLERLCTYLYNSENYTKLGDALNVARKRGFLFYCQKSTHLIFLKSNEIGEKNQIIFIHTDQINKLQLIIKQIVDGKFCSCRKVRCYFGEIEGCDPERTEEGNSTGDIIEELNMIGRERDYFKKYERIVDDRRRIRNWYVVMAGDLKA